MTKPRKQSSSSSSSSDEDDERIQQFKDSVVTLESLGSFKKTDYIIVASELKSKRMHHLEADLNQNLDNDSDDLNNFKLTPEFQQFVAKRLQKKLDEGIELVDSKHKVSNGARDDVNQEELEITKDLYFNLKDSVNESSKQPKQKKPKKKCKNDLSDSDSDSELARLKEAAVGSDYLAQSTSIEMHKKSFTLT